MEKWNAEKSSELFGIDKWGNPFFRVNEQGHICVRPAGNGPEVNLYEITSSLAERGIQLPALLRFDGIIRSRLDQIYNAFQTAITESQYSGQYRLAYPIKVNQQRHVVEAVRLAGRQYQVGLEVGSKPEMVAVLAIHDTPGALLLCNGYKDSEYIELALLSRKVGRRSIIIIEQAHELELVLQASQKLGIEAEIGIRFKPSARSSGRWEASSGEYAKFGLRTPEITYVVRQLEEYGKKHWLKLLHFHIGSQIPSIGSVKAVMREATRMYVELYQMCPSLSFLDVGGGLAVDYDGSRTNFESSMNYTLEEYARDIVDSIELSCAEANIPRPDIISESGRALVAHHAVLVCQVLDVEPTLEAIADLGKPPTDHEVLERLRSLYDDLTVKNCQETLNDALSMRDEVHSRFVTGDLNLVERAYADKSFGHLIAKLVQVSRDLKFVPEDLELLQEKLRDTYFSNFSVFQSLPDSWAIDHLFPIMPIHRLDEKPTRRGIIADMTCDSDGKIDRFCDLKDVRKFLNFHPVRKGEPYYFAIFLVGAYQEILGDLHNLFGDTNAVHIETSANGGGFEITNLIEGDTVREVLSYVQFEPEELVDSLRRSVERSLEAKELTAQESAELRKKFREALEEYTYLRI